MEELTIETLLDLVKTYNSNPEELDIIRKAYDLASNLHDGQFRQSGEPYIIHPLNVAYILAEMHVDTDTLCACLLHDTLEDTVITKEEIATLFNSEVAKLVDGVTKISKMNFSSKNDEVLANLRKIVTGIIVDVRIILIKLADRLHNMRTLQYKRREKQIENAQETLDVFVPLAYYIGAYRVKSELEDLSLRYLEPDKYKKLSDIQLGIEAENRACLEDMVGKIQDILFHQQIPNEIKIRIKNIYGIYKRMRDGHKLSDIHDLLSLKIMVDEVSDCYLTLGRVHALCHPVNSKFKDYICNPKTNMYQSLHTTVFGENGRLVQTQIRTFNMDKVASFGLATYWDINKGDAREKMQEDLKNKFQFFSSLKEIDNVFGSNQDFFDHLKQEIFTNKVYVYTTKGAIIELPKGSTPIDFAYKIKEGDDMVAAVVNGENVAVDYILRNQDRVQIVRDPSRSRDHFDWEKNAHTTYAKRKIREFARKD